MDGGLQDVEKALNLTNTFLKYDLVSKKVIYKI